MINFVVVEDNLRHRKNTEKLIVNYMMKNKYEFKISEFDKLTSELENLIKRNENNQIYVFDFELPNATAIDLARLVREEDWNSPIIILTAHGGMAFESFKQRLQILDFISKQFESDKNLIEDFDICLKQLNVSKSLKFKSDSIDYNIAFDKIFYIYRDSFERKLYIVTDGNEYKVRLTLKEIKEKLPNYFKYSHKACLINTKKVQMLDWKNSEVYFVDGNSTNLLSRTHKKELVNS